MALSKRSFILSTGQSIIFNERPNVYELISRRSKNNWLSCHWNILNAFDNISVGQPGSFLENLTLINKRNLILDYKFILELLIIAAFRRMFTSSIKINVKHTVRVSLFITSSYINWFQIWYVGENHTDVLYADEA
jgi:hypothetical protein